MNSGFGSRQCAQAWGNLWLHVVADLAKFSASLVPTGKTFRGSSEYLTAPSNEGARSAG